jgi:hypothetical protein
MATQNEKPLTANGADTIAVGEWGRVCSSARTCVWSREGQLQAGYGAIRRPKPLHKAGAELGGAALAVASLEHCQHCGTDSEVHPVQVVPVLRQHVQQRDGPVHFCTPGQAQRNKPGHRNRVKGRDSRSGTEIQNRRVEGGRGGSRGQRGGSRGQRGKLARVKPHLLRRQSRSARQQCS